MWLSVLGAAALFSWAFFATLDRPLAGQAVSVMLKVHAWWAIGSAAVLLMTWPKQDARRLVIGMLVCALTIYFGLQPMMAELRAQAAAGTLTADMKTQFGLLHLGSVLFYAAESLMGVLLVVRLTRR
ncbi:DUF4149 domain-containing protein [Pseudoduganella sp. GCM10020061]|uniref:DUF4149 domain-containing protein n=1 Tax=Pseudoduganella sp. GCM10020061 TaxID=3317345 RepID=UPI0036329543